LPIAAGGTPEGPKSGSASEGNGPGSIARLNVRTNTRLAFSSTTSPWLPSLKAWTLKLRSGSDCGEMNRVTRRLPFDFTETPRALAGGADGDTPRRAAVRIFFTHAEHFSVT